MTLNPNLQKLREAGVSIWLDTLSRDLLESGGFAGLISDYGVTGATYAWHAECAPGSTLVPNGRPAWAPTTS